jgi:hypothetical protein
MEIVESMPFKKPLTKKLEGQVKEYTNGLWVGDTLIPKKLERKFRKRCSGSGYMNMQEALDNKEIYLRGQKITSGVNWFGLVSGEFEEITAHGFAYELSKMDHTEQVIRYNPGRERFQIGFVVNDDAAKVMMYLDSGDFGVYGGNGECAVKIGVSAYQKDPAQWSLFKTPTNAALKTRTVHRECYPDLDKVVASNLEYIEEVKESWTANLGREYTQGEVALFAMDYVKKVASAFEDVVANMGQTIKGDDLVSAITQKAQGYAMAGRLGLEKIAGDVIMNPEKLSKRYA